MEKIYTTNSFEETRQLGRNFAKEISPFQIVALRGDLGSGKTTFVQGFAEGLGITKKIISPTFIIMRTYEVGDKIKDLGFKNFYHVDLYRVENERDVEGLGLFEIMNDPENIVVIEWPEKIESSLPKDRKDIFFTYVDDKERKIIIE